MVVIYCYLFSSRFTVPKKIYGGKKHTTDAHVVEVVIAMEVAYCTDMIKKGYPT
jgi:hypothetical protein